MILLVLFILVLTYGLFIFIKHKQADREARRRERLEEKQDELLELLRKRKEE